MMGTLSHLSWWGIVRLGCVQMALGSILVIPNSTLNRVMAVELALPAVLPGILVGLHYFFQITRPRFGHGSDVGGARTPWIIGGIIVLALGSVLASSATALMASHLTWGITLAVVAYLVIGAGVGACGTCLLVLLAAKVHPKRRAAAASITFLMMIMGFAITAPIVGSWIDPFSSERLINVTASVGIIAVVFATIAVWGIEKSSLSEETRLDSDDTTSSAFLPALREVLAESHTRNFMLFVFLSMLAYSAQDLILEPFAGAVFGLTPGESTALGGMQHSGVLIGMLIVSAVGALKQKGRDGLMRHCLISGCVGAALLLVLLGLSGLISTAWPLKTTVFMLGIATGAFAVSAIGSMMGLVSQGNKDRKGIRMGVWGTAQAFAFGLGGILGTLLVDIIRAISGSVAFAYGSVFWIQAVLFAAAAVLANQLIASQTTPVSKPSQFFTGADSI